MFPPRPAFTPDLAPLHHAGWSIRHVSGAYVVAWRESQEVVFVWKDGGWHRLTSRIASDTRAA